MSGAQSSIARYLRSSSKGNPAVPRVTVPFGNEVDVMRGTGVEVIVRAQTDGGADVLRFEADFVRLAGMDDEGVRIGLRFRADPEDDTGRITQLLDVGD